MTTHQITFLLAPYGSATLRLPERLTPDAFARLDAAVVEALHEPLGDAGAAANGPGAIEFDSWLTHQH